MNDPTPVEPAPPAFDPRPDRAAVAVAGFACLLIVIVAFARESSPAWEDVQDDVRRVVAARLGEEAASRVPSGLQQVWIPELSRVDRCTTCHATWDWGASLADAEGAARSHPLPDLLARHPVERFGCTLCHGGQGSAVTKEGAHGEDAHAPSPLLTAARAKRYGVTRAELMETNCGACHRGLAPVEGMPLLNEARTLVAQRKCQRCHLVEGAGNRVAPELTKVGDKPAEHLHFPEGWRTSRTAVRWHMEHFKDPPRVVPGTEMDIKGPVTEREAAALALLVLSWRALALPPAWTPTPAR